MTAIVGSNLHVIKVYTAILHVIIAVIIILVITVVAFTCNRKNSCDYMWLQCMVLLHVIINVTLYYI